MVVFPIAGHLFYNNTCACMLYVVEKKNVVNLTGQSKATLTHSKLV